MILNTWVDNLLGLYQHSLTGNFDNRGLASDFARKTYIDLNICIFAKVEITIMAPLTDSGKI